jgi:tripeptidyl-peptidase-1
MRFSILWSLTIAGLVSGASIDRRDGLVLHEKRNETPLEWAKHRRAAASQILPMRIGLKQRNLEHADRFMYEITDPSSSNYGR